MAIMRTNRLTSKTTPPVQTTKSVTVSNKPRRFTPSAELEAQDAAYKKYKEQDLPLYEKRMKRYNEEVKYDKVTKDYNAAFGGKKNVRYLDKAELAAYNKDNLSNNPEAIEYGAVEVGKSYSKKVGDKDWMIGAAHHTHNPIKPTAPTKVNPADWSNVELNKMSTKKPVIKTKPGRLKQLKDQEERPGFDAPGVETKTVSKTRAAMTGGGDKLVRAKNPKGNLGAARVTTESNKGKIGYNRQEKLFKSYAGTSVLDESHIGKSAQDINAYKKEMKSQRRAYRREGNLEGVAATGMEVRQARQAERFVKGKQTHFNDENYQKTTGKTTKIAEDYRDSSQNAANRNTMKSKLAAVAARGKNNTSLY